MASLSCFMFVSLTTWCNYLYNFLFCQLFFSKKPSDAKWLSLTLCRGAIIVTVPQPGFIPVCGMMTLPVAAVWRYVWRRDSRDPRPVSGPSRYQISGTSYTTPGPPSDHGRTPGNNIAIATAAYNRQHMNQHNTRVWLHLEKLLLLYL